MCFLIPEFRVMLPSLSLSLSPMTMERRKHTSKQASKNIHAKGGIDAVVILVKSLRKKAKKKNKKKERGGPRWRGLVRIVRSRDSYRAHRARTSGKNASE
jgi:hypothetical protein